MKEEIKEIEVKMEKLKKKKEKLNNKQWKKVIAECKNITDKMIGNKYLIVYESGICAIMITDVKEDYYADLSGFDGSWNDRRFLRIKGVSHSFMYDYPHAPLTSKQNFTKLIEGDDPTILMSNFRMYIRDFTEDIDGAWDDIVNLYAKQSKEHAEMSRIVDKKIASRAKS